MADNSIYYVNIIDEGNSSRWFELENGVNLAGKPLREVITSLVHDTFSNYQIRDNEPEDNEFGETELEDDVDFIEFMVYQIFGFSDESSDDVFYVNFIGVDEWYKIYDCNNESGISNRKLVQNLVDERGLNIEIKEEQTNEVYEYNEFIDYLGARILEI